MPELILLCEGAAPDREAGASPDAFVLAANEIRATVSGASLRALLGSGRLVADRVADDSVARESPADAWLRTRLSVPEDDAVQAYAAHATDTGTESPRWSLRPAHVQVGYDQVRLSDPSDLALDASDAGELAATIAPLFADAGYTLGVVSPERWFFTAERAPELQASPWTLACGRNIEPYMPGGPGARQWRRLLNEVQMHWHDHPANARREAVGRAVVNMLWLDGRAGGVLARSLDAVATGEPAISGIARAAGARLVTPTAALEGAARGAVQGEVLVDVPLWRDARRRVDLHAWVQAWHEFDQWLVRHGMSAGKGAGVARVRAVFTGERRQVELASDGAGWSRFFRRFDPLAAVL